MSDENEKTNSMAESLPTKSSSETTNDTLVAALKETLNRSGTYEDVRAQLRASVLLKMNESLPVSKGQPQTNKQPIENVLINELIAEYLSFNGYHSTLCVFSTESKTEKSSVLGREFIRAELGLNNTDTNPLAMMYEVIEGMKSSRKRSV